MLAWEEMDYAARTEVWDRFDREFSFQPSVHEEDWPGIREPDPSETYSISHVYDGEDELYAKLNRELQDWGLRAFRTLLHGETAWLFALDWQHACYRFRPHIPFAVDEFGEWPIPLLPNGDYYIFLHSEFAWGVFGHPWEQTICVFGKELLALVEQGRPTLLSQRIRRDGKGA